MAYERYMLLLFFLAIFASLNILILSYSGLFWSKDGSYGMKYDAGLAANSTSRTFVSSRTFHSDSDYINEELKKLGQQVRAYIDNIQRRSVDSNGEWGLCLREHCGFGCSLHKLVACSYRMLEEGKGFRFEVVEKSSLNPRAWKSVFLRNIHITRNEGGMKTGEIVKKKEVLKKETGPGKNKSEISSKASSIVNPIKEIHLSGIPRSVHEKVLSLHSNPTAWWVGQFASYLLKLKPEHEQKVEAFRRLKGPIVGIQVRRTDKLKHESRFYSVEEYMIPVERWFRRQEEIASIREGANSTIKRSLFIATDDPTVVNEIREKYPNYELHHDIKHAEVASDNPRRKEEAGLLSVALDVFMMVHCDYVVCTLSSNVCRLALELMQVEYGDAMGKVKSLDLEYNLLRRIQPTYHVVVLKQTRMTEDRLALEIGDKISPAYKLFGQKVWFGENLRTGQVGEYPDHAVEPLFSYT